MISARKIQTKFLQKKLFKAISSLYAGVSFYKELETYHASTGHKN